ncbi:AMP-binding protein [Oceanibacterium hippocampi]|uniref:Benzoate--CoA ligase n=1 Tax=Oceanibacterium hippocampi TaxID=745714 RepID=A0A1Y5TZB5_9PROT|nr:AMP-binding protein [Oceanibacterium hippocampi]SLN77427.1 Benzoate--CoA ligase [Oceanibacterium hippocampi]
MPEKSAHTDDFAARHLPPPAAWPKLVLDGTERLKRLPPRINCATELLDKQAEKFADRPVIHYQDKVWSYADLNAEANRIAHVLVEDLGVVPGNRVMLRAPNNPMYVACWFAVMKVGAIAVATMPLLRWRELVHMADKAEIHVALCDQRLRDEMEKAIEVSPNLERALYFGIDGADSLDRAAAAKPAVFETCDTAAEDTCLIAFTSGTTGKPKGCMHNHRDVMAICETFAAEVLRPGPEDIFTGSPPIAFTFGLGALVTFPMFVGASTVLVEQYTPETMLQTIAAYGVTTLFTAPTAYRAMIDLLPKHDISSLKACVSAGESLPLATWQAWHEATGIRTIDGLGSTEMLHIFITSAGDDIRPGATGRALAGFEAKVVDETGADVPDGVVGRLAVRGPTGCRYLDDPDRQAGYVQNGWNLTGDAYMRDADGYFWYQARTDDMIISAGYNIAGPEVEGILLEHPKVFECAVVGSPDPKRGEIVKAFVIPRDGVVADATLARELQDYVKAEIAPYKYPRAIEFVTTLPRTQTGKIQRFVLRQAEREAAEKC